MLRFSILILCAICSGLSLAKSSVQIDLILFAHPQSAELNKQIAPPTPLIPLAADAVHLSAHAPYTLLGPSQSKLKDSYYQLSRKSQLQVLGHFSWKQPVDNQKRVVLPTIQNKGWHIEGTVYAHPGTYYEFNTELQVSAPSTPQTFTSISHNQRLKMNELYYLDNPKIGMLVTIH